MHHHLEEEPNLHNDFFLGRPLFTWNVLNGIFTPGVTAQCITDDLLRKYRTKLAIIFILVVTAPFRQGVAFLNHHFLKSINVVSWIVSPAFPMGLPEFDPVRLTIEGEVGLEGTQAGSELLDEETAGLWMAGKEFRRDQVVGDRVGSNEKTRVTCKLQKPGSGPPGREPAVSEDERKAMMAYYFKRQEEIKRLAEVRACLPCKLSGTSTALACQYPPGPSCSPSL